MAERENNAVLTAVWAQNGITDIPDVPTVGQTYRNANITNSEISDGQKYTELFDSANYNQILFLLTSLTRTLCECGVMPFLRGQFYYSGAVCLYTDNQLYQCNRNIATNENPYPTPGDDTGVWKRILPDTFTGATSTTDGIMGFVPAPKAGQETKYLMGNGTWGEIATPFPTGIIMGYSGSTVPTGWLWCNGSAISRTEYADLYGVIGVSYGSGDGSTTFNLPDFRNRVMEGGSSMGDFRYISAGIPSYVHSHSGSTNTAGNHTHTITTTNAGGHTHTRGTMNITGHVATGHSLGLFGDYSGAFSKYGNYNESRGGDGGSFWTGFDFNASSTWSGETSNAGAHNHNVSLTSNGNHTHSLTINNNTESSTSVYGKSNTVQMAATTCAYIIKY